MSDIVSLSGKATLVVNDGKNFESSALTLGIVKVIRRDKSHSMKKENTMNSNIGA